MSGPRYAIVTATYEPSEASDVMTLVSTIAKYLSSRARVEILTTCADFAGRDVYPEGHDRSGALQIHRFPQSRSCARIGDYIEAFARRYNGFIFIGTPQEIVRLGVDRVAARSLAVPFDVPLDDITRVLARIAAIAYPSEAIRNACVALDPRLEGPLLWPEVIPPSTIDPARFRSTYDMYSPFLLVMGGSPDADVWWELGKNFARYCKETSSNRKLVLTGNLPEGLAGVRSVLALDDQLGEKQLWDSLAASEAAIFISDEQSAEGCLKAWALHKPIIADVRAPLAVDECRRSGGGLWFEDGDQFGIVLELLDEQELAQLGAQGSQYLTQYNSERKIGPVIASVLRSFDDVKS